MENNPLVVVDTTVLPWEERFNEKLGRALYRKNLVTDPDTGMEVRLVRYPAGVINVRHTRPKPTSPSSSSPTSRSKSTINEATPSA
jgi:hypothetical protein